MRESLLYAFYGDDFTGSTDVLEQLAANGVSSVLFLGPPNAEHLAKFADVRAIGIAGDSRSRSPEWMSATLPEVFEMLKALGAPVTHYKVCSTFDSSASIGSIGRAMELGRQIFSSRFNPIVVGAPHLRRYVVFGQLFAAAPDGTVQRIDRHPMSRHPVTPMHEADLRLHLHKQTAIRIGLVDFTEITSQGGEPALKRELAMGNEAVLFDTVDAASLAAVGAVLWKEALSRRLFSASSSGLTAGLVATWRECGLVTTPPPNHEIADASPLLVVSGSCSAVTEGQLVWAFDHGYEGIRIDPAKLLEDKGRVRAHILNVALEFLAAGRNTILYTALGLPASASPGELLGRALGDLLRDILERSRARRVLVCGGDTCSHAVPQLGAYALTWRANLQAGVPLCTLHADSRLDGTEIALKGGQIGTDDFFDVVRGVKK